MAARWAFVCALITSFGMGSAFAERRPVAVVNLDISDTSPAKALADDLVAALFTHPDLSSLSNPTDAAALKDPLDDPDRGPLAAARDRLQKAEEFLVAFNYGNAILYADDGRNALHAVTPTAARQLYADLTFVRGQASLADGRTDDALASFALVARLDPARKLDPARYLPEVVAAYATATSTAAAPGSITVDGVGRVWIDGADVGQAPGGFSVPAGSHVVWLTEPEHNTGGALAIVREAAPTVVTVKPDPAPRRLVVQRARVALAKSVDATARAAAMNNLAKLVGVSDAVLLKVSETAVVVQTWRANNLERDPGFSALREHTKEKPLEILTPLAPPKKIEKIEPPIVVKPIVVKKWYQKRPYQVGIAAGVVAAIVGIYFASQVGSDAMPWNMNVGVIDLQTVRK